MKGPLKESYLLKGKNGNLNTFKHLRIINKLSVTELAKGLNVDDKIVYSIENNEKYPSLKLLKQYCQFFKMSYQTMLLLEKTRDANQNIYRELMNSLVKATYMSK